MHLFLVFGITAIERQISSLDSFMVNVAVEVDLEVSRLGGQVRQQHCRLDFHVQPPPPPIPDCRREPSWSPLHQSDTCVGACLIAALHPLHNSHGAEKISIATLACSQEDQIWAAMQLCTQRY